MRLLEQTAEALDQTREALEPGNPTPKRLPMPEEPPSAPPKGAWGGQADGTQQHACPGCGTAVPWNGPCPDCHQKSVVQAAQRAAEYEELVKAGKAKPLPERKPRPEIKVPDMIESMAEEGIRHDLVMQKSVVVDKKVKIPGVTEGMTHNMVVTEDPSQQRQAAPGLKTPEQAMGTEAAPKPSALNLKRRSPEFQAGNALLTIGNIRGQVEEGKVDVPTMIELISAASELIYAATEKMKG